VAKRLTKGERFALTQRAVENAQLSGETNAAQALRRYRNRSNRGVRTQDWYAAWRGERQRQAAPPAETRTPKQPGKWITNVAVVWLDDRTGRERTHWHTIYTPPGRRQRMKDADAIAEAIADDEGPMDRYHLRLVYAYVTSYE
jgi:hypothetical protein